MSIEIHILLSGILCGIGLALLIDIIIGRDKDKEGFKKKPIYPEDISIVKFVATVKQSSRYLAATQKLNTAITESLHKDIHNICKKYHPDIVSNAKYEMAGEVLEELINSIRRVREA